MDLSMLSMAGHPALPLLLYVGGLSMLPTP